RDRLPTRGPLLTLERGAGLWAQLFARPCAVSGGNGGEEGVRDRSHGRRVAVPRATGRTKGQQQYGSSDPKTGNGSHPIFPTPRKLPSLGDGRRVVREQGGRRAQPPVLALIRPRAAGG